MTLKAKGRFGTWKGFTNPTGPTHKHPVDYKSGIPSAVAGDSCVQNWAYGIIHSIWITQQTTGTVIFQITSADGSRVLHNLEISAIAAQRKVYTDLNWPVYEPWAISTNVVDATLIVGGTFEIIDQTS